MFIESSNKFQNKLMNTLFYLSVFWISGFFFFPKAQLHNQIYILIFVIPAVWLIYSTSISFKSFLKSKLFWLALLYGGYYIISVLWGTYKDTDALVSEIKRALYLYAFWFTIFALYYQDKTKLFTLAKYTTILGAISVLVICILFYGVEHHTITDRLAGYGRLRNALWVAALYGAMAILMLCIALNPHQKNRLIYIALFVIFLIATLLTHSRWPIISLLLVCLLTFYSSQLSTKLKIQITIISVVILYALSLLFLAVYQADIQRGQSYRIDLWLGFLQFTKNHLFFGNGAGTNVFIHSPGSFVDGWSHYHNVYLGSLIELGLVGLFLHISLITYAIYIGWKFRTDICGNSALMIFIFSCLIGITYGQGIITRINAQWIVFWLPLFIIMMMEIESVESKKLE